MGFRDVQRAQQRAQGAQHEQDIQSVIGAGGQAMGGGKFAMPGPAVGDTSPNFYDDPTVNGVVKLPSRKEAEQYTGANPSFYGVQRPGDWQRLVQRQMAEDVVGKGALNRAGDARVRRAQFGQPS